MSRVSLCSVDVPLLFSSVRFTTGAGCVADRGSPREGLGGGVAPEKRELSGSCVCVCVSKLLLITVAQMEEQSLDF